MGALQQPRIKFKVETMPPNLLLSMLGCPVGLWSQARRERNSGGLKPQPLGHQQLAAEGSSPFPAGEGDESQIPESCDQRASRHKLNSQAATADLLLIQLVALNH